MIHAFDGMIAGDMYKVKTAFYSCAHGLNPNAIQPRHIYRAVCQDFVDDILAAKEFDVARREMIQQFRDTMQESMRKAAEKLEAFVTACRTEQMETASEYIKVHPQPSEFWKNKHSMTVVDRALTVSREQQLLIEQDHTSVLLDQIMAYVAELTLDNTGFLDELPSLMHWLHLPNLALPSVTSSKKKKKKTKGNFLDEDETEKKVYVPAVSHAIKDDIVYVVDRKGKYTKTKDALREFEVEQEHFLEEMTKLEKKTVSTEPKQTEQDEKEHDPDVCALIATLSKKDRLKIQKQQARLQQTKKKRK